MKLIRSTLSLSVCICSVYLASQSLSRALDPGVVTLVSTGACWTVHDRGQDLGTNWLQPGANDSFWLFGFGELGYGDGDEATVVSYGPDPTNKFITTYFRHQFLTPSPSQFTNLLLRVKRDDGVVVYLNGSPVYNHNLPPMPSHFMAAMPALDDGTNYLTNSVSPGLLVPGENYLAVEIHQSATNDPDISFDLALVGQYTSVSPSLSAAAVGASQFVVAWPASTSTGYVLQSSGTLISNAWSAVTNPVFLVGGSRVVTNTRTFAPRYFRLLADASSSTPCQPPIVLDQPLNVVAAIGTNVTLSVTATGTPPILYQWYKNLLPVAGGNSSSLTLTNVQRSDGGSYTLAMNGACDGNNSFPIVLTVGGTNDVMSDSFAARSLFTATSGEINSSNYFATVEAGEANHAGQPASRSMWLSYQASTDGIVTFDAAGSAFDTLLAAYRGTNVASLSLIDEDDDQGPAYTSIIRFAMTNGETAEVVVDNFEGSAGAFQLNWNFVPTNAVVPLILVQPQGVFTAIGSNFTLSVVATNPGIGSLTYQWQHNGSNIAGATLSTMTVTNVVAADTGAYNVLVSNGSNTKKSQSAFVTAQSVTGRLITVTTANKRRTCGTTNYYSGYYTNISTTPYFNVSSEPVTVRTWDTAAAPVTHRVLATRQAPAAAPCGQTWVPIDPAPALGGPYNYYFQVLIYTVPTTFSVDHIP